MSTGEERVSMIISRGKQVKTEEGSGWTVWNVWSCVINQIM